MQITVRASVEDAEKLKAIAQRARLDVGPYLLTAGFEKARRDGLLEE